LQVKHNQHKSICTVWRKYIWGLVHKTKKTNNFRIFWNNFGIFQKISKVTAETNFEILNTLFRQKFQCTVYKHF
jgi:hypothetical protein